MDSLTIALRSQGTQTEFNLRRWAELVADPKWIRVEGRVETDRHGHVLMSPPPAASHGGYQSRITVMLDRLMPGGEVFTECPISTADGVRAADVAWASRECLAELGDGICFPHAPEICVEVLSPDNTAAEMREKTALYFDAGAREVWHCSQTGTMTFFSAGQSQPLPASKLCPDFPALVKRR
ncbi:MAG: Uma2 family endonuclease [Verrucomicrobia bacterium]|nr:Uma2 family endonuclease [Verrucomicrobiota bacterium]